MPSDKVLTVSQLTRQLQHTLRDRFADVWVAGEISSLSQPASGHIYLTLGDDRAQIRGVIWRSDAERLEFQLQDGLQVICRGQIDIYPPRGAYQLIIRQLEPEGVGAQQLALKQLHARLAAEGIFDADRKRPLPLLPRRVAVVTSPTGAAVRDFLQVVTRRWPDIEILVIPARVQGSEAALEIAQGIVVASHLRRRPDVLVVTRGGGSAEDLWSFNDERVVRAVAASPLPVVSAVGHEIDVTLCDLAADVRALTPSEAGELVVPLRRQVQASLGDLRLRMQQALQKTLNEARQRLQALQSRRVLTEPEQLLHVARRQVDELEFRLVQIIRRQLERGEHKVAVVAGRLQAVSPLNVLARGYSVTETRDGRLIRSADDVQPGDEIRTRLQHGEVSSQVLRSAAGGKSSDE
jgi:exodeoxyribonuclease VII large subunit